MALNRTDASGQLWRGGGVAQPPAWDGVGLGKPINSNTTALHLGRDGGDGEMDSVIIK